MQRSKTTRIGKKQVVNRATALAYYHSGYRYNRYPTEIYVLYPEDDVTKKILLRKLLLEGYVIEFVDTWCDHQYRKDESDDSDNEENEYIRNIKSKTRCTKTKCQGGKKLIIIIRRTWKRMIIDKERAEVYIQTENQISSAQPSQSQAKEQ